MILTLKGDKSTDFWWKLENFGLIWYDGGRTFRKEEC